MSSRAHLATRLARRFLSVGWVVVLVPLIGLAVWSHLDGLVIVGGSSMAPALPVGSLVRPEPVDPAEIRPGDVVTVRADNGVLVTHRVTRLADLPSGRHLELRGDANPNPDSILVSADAVVGRVDQFVPLAGYLLAMLASIPGLVAMIALFGAWLVGIWLLEDLEAGRAAQQPAPAPAAPVTERGHAAR